MNWAGKNRELVILGAGGHAKVVLATAMAAGWSCLSLYDDDASKQGQEILGVTISGQLPSADLFPDCWAVIAFGGNALRKQVAHRYPTLRWATVVHPSAVVHESVRLGFGTVVFAGCVIQPDTVIGSHCIINTSTSVDHDCQLGDFVHVAPGANLAGSVILGSEVFLGIGVSVIPGVRIGEATIVGAGACVVGNLASQITAIGVPARKI